MECAGEGCNEAGYRKASRCSIRAYICLLCIDDVQWTRLSLFVSDVAISMCGYLIQCMGLSEAEGL